VFLLHEAGKGCAEQGNESVLSPKEEKEIGELFRSSSAYKLAKRYETLFARLRSGEVSRLKQQANDGIALRAAWEVVLRRLPKPEEEESWVLPDDRSLSRFMGFVEGRLHVNPPDWWQRAVLRTEGFFGARILLPNEVADLKYGETWCGYFCPLNSAIFERGGNLWIRVNKNAVMVPPELEKELRTATNKASSSHICCSIDSNRWYLLGHSNRTTPYWLRCFTCAGGVSKLAWKAKGWGSKGWGGWTGFGWNFVTISANEQRVIVFGAGDDAAYIEAFNAQSGEVLFRFSTAF
jgi:hypothetical protein